MSTQEDRLVAALEAVAERDATGPLDVHVNLVIDAGMNEVADALVDMPDLHLNRSRALRRLLLRGARAELADRRRAFRRATA
jgi:hypothetical protein